MKHADTPVGTLTAAGYGEGGNDLAFCLDHAAHPTVARRANPQAPINAAGAARPAWAADTARATKAAPPSTITVLTKATQKRTAANAEASSSGWFIGWTLMGRWTD